MKYLLSNITLVIFVLSGLWTYSDSADVTPDLYYENNNQILPRFKRQDTSQSDGKCKTPSQPKNGKWRYLSEELEGTDNELVVKGTVIGFSCNKGYRLSSTLDETMFVFCLSTDLWNIPIMPTCEKLCPIINSNKLLTVKCDKDGSIVPCDKATENTTLTYRCAPYYESPYKIPTKITCSDGTWNSSPKCTPVCGEKKVSALPLIADGIPRESGDFPWVVALYSNQNMNSKFTFLCGGSIVTINVVLTAAHCVTNVTHGKPYEPKYFQVGAGKFYREHGDPRDSNTAQYAEVEEIQVHPSYRGEVQNYRGDIALLKLKTHFAFSQIVQPVCLSDRFLPESGTIGVVSGWGYSTETKPSEELKEVTFPYISDDECYDKINEDFAQRYLLPDKFCSGFSNSGGSICTGDGGNGLAFRNPLYGNRYFIQGILSLTDYTTKKGGCNAGALFTRIDSNVDWIHHVISGWQSV